LSKLNLGCRLIGLRLTIVLNVPNLVVSGLWLRNGFPIRRRQHQPPNQGDSRATFVYIVSFSLAARTVHLIIELLFLSCGLAWPRPGVCQVIWWFLSHLLLGQPASASTGSIASRGDVKTKSSRIDVVGSCCPLRASSSPPPLSLFGHMAFRS
jgi:hypothetical protein